MGLRDAWRRKGMDEPVDLEAEVLDVSNPPLTEGAGYYYSTAKLRLRIQLPGQAPQTIECKARGEGHPGTP